MRAPSLVAIVVPNWNSIEHLTRCLSSLGNQDVEIELLVVDNGSDDGSITLLEREGVAHIALPRNTGFANAVNLGAQRTVAPTLMILNADARLEPGCLGKLLEALEAKPTLGGVQPRILQLEKDNHGEELEPAQIYSVGQSLTRDGRGFEEGSGEVQELRHLAPTETFGVCGAACLLRREMFVELGGYDERYFAFCEDVDLNVRAHILGWTFEYVPDAVVWHIGNAVWLRGFRDPSGENARLVARNRLATQLKFMPANSVLRIGVIEIGSLAQAAADRRFGATLRGKLEALRWLPSLIRERRSLSKKGALYAARAWLGRHPRPKVPAALANRPPAT